MKTSDFDYDLPPDRIAQIPIEPRDASRLLVLNRENGEITHTIFREIGSYLHPGDLLVLNETRVIPARLYARKIPTGGKVELLLLRRQEEMIWEVLGGGKGLNPGQRLKVEGGPQAQVEAVLDGPRRLVRFDQAIETYFPIAGHVPLPPYIHEPLEDPQRYQTVYAHQPGSVAAPTAGLHFTPDLIRRLENQGIGFTKVLLHVGLDTFAPVKEDDPQKHTIHTEWCLVSAESARQINQTRRTGGRVIAVGTTSVRTLESAAFQAQPGMTVGDFEGPTGLYILPGFKFKAVQALITNFHLPRSTLIMLVSAFAGRQTILNTYRIAMEEGYRFYSFGDAMLIL